MHLLHLLHRCFQDTRFHIISPAVLTLIIFASLSIRLNRRTGKEYFHIFFRMSTYFYATITKNANLINILVNITEDNVDWNIFQAKTSVKYSRSRYDGKSGEMTSSTCRDESRVFVRMPGCVNLLPVAVPSPKILTSTDEGLSPKRMEL